jgi:hypothetical protein
MPPRYAYWTIVAGGLPTAFRAAEREELLPTFNRIQEKHPDAEMKYFARGKLWASQEEARAAAEARRAADRRPDSRGRDWRPGGEHRDPRQKFKDAKKERNLEWRKQRFERRGPVGRAFTASPERSPHKHEATRRDPPRRNRPPQETSHGDPFRRLPRPFARNRFDRNQGTEEPKAPPRPKGPDRRPKPGEVPPPPPPLRLTEPAIRPPGPPERGRRSGGPIKGRRRRS